MAKIIPEQNHLKDTTVTYSIWLIALVGAFLGLAFWCLTAILANYMIEPIFCHSTTGLSGCITATTMAGDIATILTGTLGIVVMISLKMVRPLIIAVASAAVLWGLAGWTSGLVWFEAIIWSVFLYTISYVLFSWIARYLLIRPVLITMLMIIIIARIATML